MKLRFAYNTNGAAHHRLEDALSLIADSGYDGVALTLDHHHFDPFAPDFYKRAEALHSRLENLRLGVVVETGARFLMDPRAKHEPTLISPEPEARTRRVEFLERAIDLARLCRAEAVSFWAGVPRVGVNRTQAWQHFTTGVRRVAEYASRHEVVVALEPEPGMLIETVDDYKLVKSLVAGLHLALDTGHCLATGEREPEDAVREMRDELAVVAIEDMLRGVHEHLPFGAGDMNVSNVLAALRETNFTGLVCVELSRDSHRAHTMIPDALHFLQQTEQALLPR